VDLEGLLMKEKKEERMGGGLPDLIEKREEESGQKGKERRRGQEIPATFWEKSLLEGGGCHRGETRGRKGRKGRKG